jgi:hypothetical protein
MKALSRLGLASLALLLAPALVRAQENPTYDPKGRRDPFVSYTTLLSAEKPSCPGPGLPSRLVQEVTLTGIVSTAQGRRALLVGSDGQTLFAAENSRLCDGHVLRIDADAIVFVRHLRDPLLPEREIEIRRLLHPER